MANVRRVGCVIRERTREVQRLVNVFAKKDGLQKSPVVNVSFLVRDRSVYVSRVQPSKDLVSVEVVNAMLTIRLSIDSDLSPITPLERQLIKE